MSRGSAHNKDDNYATDYIDRLLLYAAQQGVSDIHIEPQEVGLRVRLRVDGSLIEFIERPRPEGRDSIIARLKILAKLDIAEKRLPQDGATTVEIPGRGRVDIRVNSLPTIWGEAVVMRLLDKTNLQADLTKLGFDAKQLEIFRDAIHKPYGMVLVTGPTGSGKTTSLYSALQDINHGNRCILTAEDPVEYNLAGIRQVQVRTDIGYTFARALKSFLRQDPDIIMVGEMRDPETTEMGLRAALTGHLVLSTLHTNSAAETLVRLTDMGAPPYVIASALNAVVAQRLIRRACTHCKKPVSYPAKTLIAHGLPPKYAGSFPILAGQGCQQCNNTGYRGRIAIYEILTVTETIKHAISCSASAATLKRLAINAGMQTLRQSAWRRISEGVTTIEEMLAQSQPDNDAEIKRS